MAVGRRITERRHALGITQHQLADRVSAQKAAAGKPGLVQPGRISQWESGKALPRTLLGELCSALDASPNWLLYGLTSPTEADTVDLTHVRRLFSDDDLAHLDRQKIAYLAKFLEGSQVGPDAAKAALLLLFPRPQKR